MVRIEMEVDAVLVNQLMQQCGIDTKKELFTNAIALLSFAINARANGDMFASVDPKTGSYKEVKAPYLDYAYNNRPR